MKITVPIQKLDHAHDLDLPFYATEQSAGMDLHAAISDDIILLPGKRCLVPTGIAIALPKGFEAQIRSRSGLAIKNGLAVLNAPGTIDADYRGEIIAIMINLGEEPFTITRGMRIAQMVIGSFSQVDWLQSENLDETARGSQRFGSTGL
jgi:dUTP pyrophosphatase